MAEKELKRDPTSGTFSGEKPPKRTEWVYSMSGIFRDACYALVAYNFLNYAKTAGLLESGETYKAQLGVIIILSIIALIWDGINDPLMGIIIEKCHFKTGKYRPWILIGAIGNCAAVLLMYLAKPTGWWFVACFGIFYFLWDFVFTMNDIAYWSMLPSLTNDEKERNKLTTMVSVAAGIGQAAMGGLTGLLVKADNINTIYGWLAIPTAILFLASQTAIFFLCKERARDPKQEAISQKTKLTDLFTMVHRNAPLRMVVFAIFFDYLMGAITGSFGMDYFYFTYGFGGGLGGYIYVVQGVFTTVFSLLAQVLYGKISKKWNLMKILDWSFFIALGLYAIFFILAVPLFGDHPLAYSPLIDNESNVATGVNIFAGTGWLIFIPQIFISMATSIFLLVLLVMMQNAIDYNEYKFGERKEAVAFAWRPLDAKLSSALKQGLYFLALVMTGTIAVYNTIDETTKSHNAGDITSAQAESQVQGAIANLTRGQIIYFDCLYIGLAVACLVAAYLFIKLGYHLSEEKHREMVTELEKRHAQDALINENIPVTK
jgi:melibiose permease/lactose/raffinose/galactose permease